MTTPSTPAPVPQTELEALISIEKKLASINGKLTFFVVILIIAIIFNFFGSFL